MSEREPFVGQVRPHPRDNTLFEVWTGERWLALAPNPNPGYVAPAYEVEALYERLESTEAERDRLRAALKRRVAESEFEWSGKPMSEDELDEFADHIAHPEAT